MHIADFFVLQAWRGWWITSSLERAPVMDDDSGQKSGPCLYGFRLW